MKKILKISTLALASTIVLSSCIKETFPTSSATDSQISESSKALNALVNAIPVNMAYPSSVFGSSANYGFDFGYPGLMCATDAMTGDVICTGGDDASGYDWFIYWQTGFLLGPTQTITQYPWYCYYSFIKSCNDIVGMLQAEELTATEQTYLGYAKTFRALLYLDMARLYDAKPNNYSKISADIEGLTVPIVDENTTEDMARNNPRVSRDKMFEFILNDLKDAETLLAESSSSQKTVPSLAAAYGLMARAYLWLGGFDDTYENVPTGTNAYKLAAEYARKAINASGCTIMNEETWLNKTTGFNTANSSWMWYLPQSAEGVTNLVNYIAWRSSEAIWGYAGRFVFPGATTKFFDEISTTDWRRRAFKAPGSQYSQYVDILNVDEATFNAIPDYANFKFHPAQGNIVSWTSGNVTDVPLMRVEEMYFIEAEATAHYDETAATELLTSFMANRDPSYHIPAAKSLVDEIIFQKRVEFWGEGIVFYDFKRLNYGIETGYAGTNAPTDCRYTTDGIAPWWNFCIPEVEYQQNLPLASQNNPDPTGLVNPWR